MNINQLAADAWDGVMGNCTPAEAITGFDSPEAAIDAYCEDWPHPEVEPDDESMFPGYTIRELLVIYLENNI